jgi:hypothetical protein
MAEASLKPILLRGVEVTELQSVALEKTLHGQLSAPELRGTPENLHKAYGTKVGSFLGFLKYVLGLAHACVEQASPFTRC